MGLYFRVLEWLAIAFLVLTFLAVSAAEGKKRSSRQDPGCAAVPRQGRGLQGMMRLKSMHRSTLGVCALHAIPQGQGGHDGP